MQREIIGKQVMNERRDSIRYVNTLMKMTPFQDVSCRLQTCMLSRLPPPPPFPHKKRKGVVRVKMHSLVEKKRRKVSSKQKGHRKLFLVSVKRELNFLLETLTNNDYHFTITHYYVVKIGVVTLRVSSDCCFEVVGELVFT